MLSEDFSQVLSVFEACRDISLSVSTTHGPYRKTAPVSGHCWGICCSVRQEAGKQEMCQAPRSHPGTSKRVLLFKVLWIFPKRRLDKYKNICPYPFHHYMLCQIIREMTWKYFPARLSGKLGNHKRAEGVFKPGGSLAIELCSTVISSFLFVQ